MGIKEGGEGKKSWPGRHIDPVLAPLASLSFQVGAAGLLL